jgi:hypothetical protein
MDGDRDLDLVVQVESGAGSCCSAEIYYLANIGYEKPAPPVAADINRDGRVDGADLGKLLLAWGPVP